MVFMKTRITKKNSIFQNKWHLISISVVLSRCPHSEIFCHPHNWRSWLLSFFHIWSNRVCYNLVNWTCYIWLLICFDSCKSQYIVWLTRIPGSEPYYPPNETNKIHRRNNNTFSCLMYVNHTIPTTGTAMNGQSWSRSFVYLNMFDLISSCFKHHLFYCSSKNDSTQKN